ncbi:CoA transferase [Chloroflexota bacterium]
MRHLSIIDKVIGANTVEELKDRFNDAGLIWSVVQKTTEVANDPDALQNGNIMEYSHPSRGQVKGIATPVKFSKTPARIRSCAPELGQNTEDILVETGYSWEQIQELKNKKVII